MRPFLYSPLLVRAPLATMLQQPSSQRPRTFLWELLPMIAKAKEAVCLIPGCDRLAVTRGLCASCYQAARKAVGRDATTWDEIAELGLAARKITAESLFMSELRKRREAKGLKKSKGATKRRGARR